MIKKHNLKILNSLSGEKEAFVPINKDHVGMYVCGPTVYSNVHLGNIRTFLSFDMIYRYLLHLGYNVRYVRNITDAGHLTDDGNVENDRFVRQSKLEKLEPMEIVQKYTVDFHNVLNTFNALPPTIEPTATGHIVEQIEITQDLINKGLAYEVNGSVYFDVEAYNKKGLNYGELSRRNIDDLIANTRDLDGQDEKKNPVDFALWKSATPEHIMRWNSPWGEGYPGWHIECTVMSTKYLGETFDIHGGGMDLKFPHHECEIAQGKAANKKNPVNYWMHANMLTLNGKKMSKSTGNTLLPEELFSGKNNILDRPYHPIIVRFFMLQAHYASVLDFSAQALDAAEKGFHRLMDSYNELKNIGASKNSSFDVQELFNKFYEAMNDDFNTPILIANLFEATKVIQKVKSGEETLSAEDQALLLDKMKAFIFDVLGLTEISDENDNSEQLNTIMELVLQMRQKAREEKDWTTADAIRDKLNEAKIVIKDGKDGTTWKVQ